MTEPTQRALLIAASVGFCVLLSGAIGVMIGDGSYGAAVMGSALFILIAASAWRIWQDR